MVIKDLPAHSVRGPVGAEAWRWWYRLARDPLDAYAALARRYGDAIRLPLGRRRTFFILSRPEHAEHVLVSRQDNYVKSFTYKPLRALLGDGLVTSEGDVWQRHRRLANPVFAHRHITGFAPEMTAATAEGTRRWQPGSVIDVAGELHRITLDVAGRTMFGVSLTPDADRTGRALTVLQHGTLIGTLGSFVTTRAEAAVRTAFRHVPGPAAAWTHLNRLADRVITARRAAGEQPTNLLDLLMASDSESALSDSELHDEVLTLLLAGHETTAATLTWTLILLSRHPAVREHLEAEVDDVLAGRTPDAADLDRLPWTRAVLSEAMRLYPAVWTLERDAVAPDAIAGIDIPAGATVVVPPYLLHRNQDFWPNPEGFRPERFLDTADRPRYAYLPFGGGRRICIGAGFAAQEATLVLATIARRFRLDLEPGTTIRRRAEITLHPAGPVPMRVSRRG